MAQDLSKISMASLYDALSNELNGRFNSSIPLFSDGATWPMVGDYIMGSPTLRNEFFYNLVNRIAFVYVKDHTFNNPFKRLKKGFLSTGESVEEIFVNIANVYAFNPNDAEKNLAKRTIPDVRSAFHVTDWRAQYAVSIEYNYQKQAFLGEDAARNFTNYVIASLEQGQEYDEYLLFKYMLIKAVANGHMATEKVADGDPSSVMKSIRKISNLLTFRSADYNEEHVLNVVPKDRQILFVDAAYEAEMSVDVLANAFNLDKVEYVGNRYLVDSFTTFDNDRWNKIRSATAESSQSFVEEVTPEELALMKNVKAIMVSDDWFQVYDSVYQMDNMSIPSGMRYNYWLNSWKVVGRSPFAPAVAIVSDAANVTAPASIACTVTMKMENKGKVSVLITPNAIDGLVGGSPQFVQTEEATTAKIVVFPYGQVSMPAGSSFTPQIVANGVTYDASAAIEADTVEVGASVTFNKSE